jgi:ATP-binding cassette subfamily B protein
MFVIGGRRVILGYMTPGSLVAMFRYLGMLIWPLMGAGFMVNMIQRGAVCLGRINEILNTIPSIKDCENTVTAAPDFSVPALELSGLTFSYNEKETALEGINLKLIRGGWLGIMGKTGCGKSTLIKTFTRTLDPPMGSVKVFGLDVRKWPLEDLRKLFAVTPQDSYLFSDSVANNISYGFSGADKKDVDKAIDFAFLNKDLSLFQNGKDTLIGERGLTLSGGQKQRTAIARAVIMDSEFLILDDSLSAVDNETEQKILEALRRERKGRTTIIISHRVSTLKYSDNVLVMDKGKMIEYGSPSQLISAGGFYSRMAEFQRLELKPAGEGNG